MESSEQNRNENRNDIGARLEAKLAQLRAELRALAEADRGARQAGAQMQYGKRIGDHTGDALEHTRKVGMAESLEPLAREVEAALERLEAGSYGLCLDCRRPIAPARLGVLPWAARCLECQAREERHGPPRRR